jgi:hypothetical protein
MPNKAVDLVFDIELMISNGLVMLRQLADRGDAPDAIVSALARLMGHELEIVYSIAARVTDDQAVHKAIAKARSDIRAHVEGNADQ